MSEEEKQIIEKIRRKVEHNEDFYDEVGYTLYFDIDTSEQIKTLMNLLDRLLKKQVEEEG